MLGYLQYRRPPLGGGSLRGLRVGLPASSGVAAGLPFMLGSSPSVLGVMLAVARLRVGRQVGTSCRQVYLFHFPLVSDP